MVAHMTLDDLVRLIGAGSVANLRTSLEGRGQDDVVNTPTKEGLYPIHLAAIARNSIIVDLLLAAGADPNQGSKENGYLRGYTAAHYAARNDDTATLEVLAKYDADFNRPSAEELWTPLHVAAFRGKAEAVEHLLSRGADVDSKNDKAHTPLVLAVNRGHSVVVRFFLTHGANINQKDANGDTVLHYALHFRWYETLKGRYDIPLEQLEIAVLLALFGASPTTANAEGRMPAYYVKTIPCLQDVLCVLSTHGDKLRRVKKDWTYTALVDVKKEILAAAGVDPTAANVVCSAMAELTSQYNAEEKRREVQRGERETKLQMDMERALAKGLGEGTAATNASVPASDPSGGRCPFFQKSNHATRTAPSLPEGHPPVAAADLGLSGGDPSGGKCPFLKRQAAAARAASSLTPVPPHRTDENKPLCPFSIAFVRRHQSSLLLVAAAFALGIVVDRGILQRR